MINLCRYPFSGWGQAALRNCKRPGNSANIFKQKDHPIRRSLSLLLISLFISLTLPLTASAATERIQQPSGQSIKADKALMLDIAQAGKNLIAVGDRGYILSSSDQGKSWQQINSPVSVALTDVYFVDEQYGWAVGHGGVILQTQDGGHHWQLQTDGNRINHSTIRYYQNHLAEFETQLTTLNGVELEEAEIALEELQYKLEDAEVALEDGPSNPLLSVWFKNRNEGWAVGAYGMILNTQDGGETWTPKNLSVPNPDGFHYNKIASISDDTAQQSTLIIVGEAGTLYRLVDSGENWQALDSPYEGSFFGFQALNQSGALIAYGLRGNAFISSDQGDRWSPLNLPSRESIMASTIANNRLVLLGGSGSLWYSALPISESNNESNKDTNKVSGNPSINHSDFDFKRFKLARTLPISAALKTAEQQLTLVGFGGIRSIHFNADNTQSEESK